MADQDRVGQQLGSYRLKKLLGKGGFAKVYLGEHVHTQWPMAIKVLNDITLNTGDQQSFMDEAKVIRRLKHTHIIRVTDFGIVDTSVPYIVMDYAPNGTLQERHPKHSIVPFPQIERYVNNVAGALYYAHNLSVVHCDVKPANMLVDSTNDILLSDFGIAVTGQASKNPVTIKNSAIIQGTIAYIAPERLEHGITLPSCDQYALGIIVYEWLTGVRPFEGTEQQIMIKHVQELPPPLYGVYNNVTQEIETVVMKALAKDPAQRYPSIEDFSTALSQALRAATVSSTNTQPQQRQSPPSNPGLPNTPPQPTPAANPGSQSTPPLNQNVPPPPSNPGYQSTPSQPQQQGYGGYQGTQQQQANYGTQGAYSTAQSFSPNAQQAQVVAGPNPGQANTTTSFIGGANTTARQGPSNTTLWGQLLNEWNSLTGSYGGLFELDGEFARMQKNKAFRDAGFLLNTVSAILIGFIQQSPGEAFVALFFSVGLFFLCVRLVNQISSVVCGLLVALYWGYFGAVLGGGFSTLVHALGPYAPATLLGLGFLSASAYLHIRYVQNRLA